MISRTGNFVFVSFHSNKYILIWMVKSKTNSVTAPFLLFSRRWRAVMCLKTNLFSFHLLLSAWGSCIRAFSSSTFTFQHNYKQLREEKHLSGPKTSRGVCRHMERQTRQSFITLTRLSPRCVQVVVPMNTHPIFLSSHRSTRF